MKRRMAAMLASAMLLALALGARPRMESASGRPPGLLVWIELDRKRLLLYENGEIARTYPIAAGRADTPSPVGVFRVTHRFATELSGFGTRFLGLSVPWGQYGIHGTNAPASIGQNASHGCIRLRVADAEEIYRLVPNGTRVVIESGAYGPLFTGLRSLREGDRGADVLQLQRRLILQGWLQGPADGVFGPSTRRAVVAARKALSMPPGDAADAALQSRLGMMLFE